MNPSASSVFSVVDSFREDRIVWAVRTVTTLIPLGRTCLTEALTVQALMRRAGLSCSVRFGVTKREATPGLAAHAWVERGTRRLLGGETVGRYDALESWSAMPARIANSTALAGIRRPVSHTL